MQADTAPPRPRDTNGFLVEECVMPVTNTMVMAATMPWTDNSFNSSRMISTATLDCTHHSMASETSSNTLAFIQLLRKIHRRGPPTLSSELKANRMTVPHSIKCAARGNHQSHQKHTSLAICRSVLAIAYPIRRHEAARMVRMLTTISRKSAGEMRPIAWRGNNLKIGKRSAR